MTPTKCCPFTVGQTVVGKDLYQGRPQSLSGKTVKVEAVNGRMVLVVISGNCRMNYFCWDRFQPLGGPW